MVNMFLHKSSTSTEPEYSLTWHRSPQSEWASSGVCDWADVQSGRSWHLELGRSQEEKSSRTRDDAQSDDKSGNISERDEYFRDRMCVCCPEFGVKSLRCKIRRGAIKGHQGVQGVLQSFSAALLCIILNARIAIHSTGCFGLVSWFSHHQLWRVHSNLLRNPHTTMLACLGYQLFSRLSQGEIRVVESKSSFPPSAHSSHRIPRQAAKGGNLSESLNLLMRWISPHWNWEVGQIRIPGSESG
jgi:hypothetical protein